MRKEPRIAKAVTATLRPYGTRIVEANEDVERESVDKFVSETYGCHFGPKSTAFSTLARLDIRKQPVLLLHAHNCCSAAIMHVCIVLCCILLWNLHY